MVKMIIAGGDFGDFTQKFFTKDEILEHAQKCTIRCFSIRESKMHVCTRSYRSMELNVIPGNKDEYINFLMKI